MNVPKLCAMNWWINRQKDIPTDGIYTLIEIRKFHSLIFKISGKMKVDPSPNRSKSTLPSSTPSSRRNSANVLQMTPRWTQTPRRQPELRPDSRSKQHRDLEMAPSGYDNRAFDRVITWGAMMSAGGFSRHLIDVAFDDPSHNSFNEAIWEYPQVVVKSMLRVNIVSVRSYMTSWMWAKADHANKSSDGTIPLLVL